MRVRLRADENGGSSESVRCRFLKECRVREKEGREEGGRREKIVLVFVSAIYKRNEGKRRGSRAGLNTARPHAKGQTFPPVSQLWREAPSSHKAPSRPFSKPSITPPLPTASASPSFPPSSASPSFLPPIHRTLPALCSPSARPRLVLPATRFPHSTPTAGNDCTAAQLRDATASLRATRTCFSRRATALLAVARRANKAGSSDAQ